VWLATPVSPPYAPEAVPVPSRDRLPSFPSQVCTLACRQWMLFFRDRAQIILHLSVIVVFPLLVILFAYDGLPLVHSLPLALFQPLSAETVSQQIQTRESFFRAGSLVSGLAMFQVILLTLMGANNGAREIARERDIFEKEAAVGVRPIAYLWQKFFYVAALCVVQGCWMCWVVSTACGFPGATGEKSLILVLVTLALSSLSLALSAASPNPERASLLSLYLVGFQLPLSGAILALPETARWMTQPFISAYWGWSGYVRTFIDSPYYDAVSQVSNTRLASFEWCVVVLSLHIVAGFFATRFFLQKRSAR
jgi:hypothetical protein